jgi:hypothetical protein
MSSSDLQKDSEQAKYIGILVEFYSTIILGVAASVGCVSVS